MRTSSLDFEVDDLPEGWTPVGVVVVVKCWDPQGKVKFACRYSPEINEAERFGMHEIAIDRLTEDMVEADLIGETEEEEDDGSGV